MYWVLNRSELGSVKYPVHGFSHGGQLHYQMKLVASTGPFVRRMASDTKVNYPARAKFYHKEGI